MSTTKVKALKRINTKHMILLVCALTLAIFATKSFAALTPTGDTNQCSTIVANPTAFAACTQMVGGTASQIAANEKAYDDAITSSSSFSSESGDSFGSSAPLPPQATAPQQQTTPKTNSNGSKGVFTNF